VHAFLQGDNPDVDFNGINLLMASIELETTAALAVAEV
jgi:hypothetical protein